MRKQEDATFRHGEARPDVGILLTNLGSPESPTPSGLRRFYAEFLADRRVIEVPKLVWWCILNLFILPVRPFIVQKQYKEIWLEEGSPLLVICDKLLSKVRARMEQRYGADNVVVELGMRYGNPSIQDAVARLQEKRVRSIVVLPLYPQAAAATTATTFDAVADALRSFRYVPTLRTIMGYHDEPVFVRALADSVRRYWDEQGSDCEVILFSFHGVPRKTLQRGDPYHCFCLKTARLVAAELQLKFFEADHAAQWSRGASVDSSKPRFAVSFQSRFLFAEWVKPYTIVMLEELAKAGVRRVDVVAPAFSADCLETLEEISVQLSETFKEHGGKRLRYIPALNDHDDAVDVYESLLVRHCSGLVSEKGHSRTELPPSAAVQRSKCLGWSPRAADE